MKKEIVISIVIIIFTLVIGIMGVFVYVDSQDRKFSEKYVEQQDEQQDQTIKLYPGAPLQYTYSYHIELEDAIKLIKQKYGIDVVHTMTSNMYYEFQGGGHKFIVERWYITDDINSISIYSDIN